MAASVDCPVCGKQVAWTPASPWRPFCSERCKTIDLGDWASERHVIPGSSPGLADEEPSGEADDKRG